MGSNPAALCGLATSVPSLRKVYAELRECVPRLRPDRPGRIGLFLDAQERWIEKGRQKKGDKDMVKVELQSDESQEQLLRRFRKKVSRSRLMSEVRRKRWFVPKSELRRLAEKKAVRRARRRRR